MRATADSDAPPITDRLPDDAREAGCRTLVDVFRLRAAGRPEFVAYRFLPGGDAAELELTFGLLDRRARTLAAEIRRHARPGDRALLLFAPGLEYVTAFVACLYAGVVAVPAYPPHPRRPDERVPGMVVDCDARLALTTGALLGRLDRWRVSVPAVAALHWIATDQVDEARDAEWCVPDASPDALAMLQYTSGSTSAPRGVRLSHANLISNLALVFRRFEHRAGDVGVFWLPPFHDMGLIGAILQPAYAGRAVVLMPPATFLQRPMSWLEAVSRYGATTSGAPNFAYDLCVDRSTPAERAALDLSAWRTAFNGAEPVRAETIERFARAFAPSGFRPEAFMPCYGLAEATLMVSGGPAGGRPTVACVSRAALEHGSLRGPSGEDDAMQLVASGSVADGHEVRIVDPVSHRVRADDEIGEIWVCGPSVGGGYWSGDGETFGARLPGDERRWLRTGDLGALRGGRLFVTGRLKDLVIVAGRNVHPQDVEAAAERSHPDLRPGHAAAFAVPTPGGERLAVAVELSRHADGEEHEDVIAAVRDAVVERVGVRPHEVVLLRQGSILRTSSGKIRRGATRDALLDGSLPVLGRDARIPVPRGNGRRAEGAEWLRGWLAREVGHSHAYGDATLRNLGLESLDVVRLAVDAERDLEVRVDPGALWAAGTVDAVAALVSGASATTASAAEPTTEIEGMRALEARLDALRDAGLAEPYFVPHEGVSADTTGVAGRTLLSFASYNYLGLAGDDRVVAAAIDATRRLGTSVSASRLISGERELHRDLECELARFVGAESALALVSGHATNVTTIPCLVGDGDLVVADALAHDSIVQGARLSGARRLVFPHNDWRALDALLGELRPRYRRVLVVVEGVYSADGDVPDLARFVEVKRRHRGILMLDEAHSLGVLGATGRGLPEHAGVAPGDVDVLMGTLSKALASCGGYVAGSARLVRYLRYAAAGFVFSVGLSPANAAAALESLRVLRAEPQRVARLRANAARFRALAREAGADVGASRDTPVIPVIVGDSLRAVRLSARLAELGVSAPPMVSPAVPERQARVRFFVTSEHAPAQLEEGAAALRRALVDCGG